MEEKNYGPNKKFIMFTIVAILVLCTGVTLAYWIGDIFGTGNPMTFKSANLRILFTDGEAINAQNIKPGWSTSKTFSVENEGDTPYKYNIIIKDLINTFTYTKGLQYKITSTNGFNMEDYEAVPKSAELTKKVLAYSVEIGGTATHNYTIEFRYYDDPDVDQSEDMGKEFAGTLFIEEGTMNPNLLSYKLVSKYETVSTRTNFDVVVGTETATEGVIYKTTERWQTEDGSEVYYFAGNVADNWVKFGRDKDNADLYWRIIRTNEDGSVRLLYAGTDPSTSTAYVEDENDSRSTYGEFYNDTRFVGYAYGIKGNLDLNRAYNNFSRAKNRVDTWYNNNLNQKRDSNNRLYSDYISKTAIYCNDRSTGEYASSGYMYYAGYNRLIHNNKDGRKPTYKCGYNPVEVYKSAGDNNNTVWKNIEPGLYSNASVADKFSADESHGGNGLMYFPAGLMTADEVVFAGGKDNQSHKNVYYYLNSTNNSVTGSKFWWTMTPYGYIDGGGQGASVFVVSGYSGYGKLFGAGVENPGTAIRPVVSLKSCATILGGNGKSDTPYEINIDEACASAVN